MPILSVGGSGVPPMKKKRDIELAWEKYARGQEDYCKWNKESGYTMGWVL